MSKDDAKRAKLLAELGLMPQEDVATLRDMTIQSLRNERSRHKGPPFTKLGKRVYYPKSALIEYLTKMTVTSR